MAYATDTTSAAQDQVIDLVRQGQDATVKSVQAWTDALQRFVPVVPGVPTGEYSAQPAELIDSTFAFAERLLSTQRDFAHELLDATQPVRDKVQPKTNRK